MRQAKWFGWIVLSCAMLANAAPAASRECRHIDSRKERNACYEQQKQVSKTSPAPRAATGDDVDRLKLENDRLNKRLQGICRGC
jgi:hypothetical protein